MLASSRGEVPAVASPLPADPPAGFGADAWSVVLEQHEAAKPVGFSPGAWKVVRDRRRTAFKLRADEATAQASPQQLL